MLTGALTAPSPPPRPATSAAAPAVSGATGESVVVVARPVALEWPEAASARLLGAVALTAGDSRFGGLSGLDVSPDGGRVAMVSDRGTLFTAAVQRRGGALAGLADVRLHPLRDNRNEPVSGDFRDAEALARLPSGDLVVAFEGEHRLWRYAAPGGRAFPVTPPEGFASLQINSGVEALAADALGRLYAIPERSGDLARPFPVWRRDTNGRWEAGRWPRRPPYLVTGADIGSDGRLYVIERDFGWLGGWSMRLSRADLDDWPDLRPATLVELVRGGIDNMESVAVWRTAEGELRALLLADDNFHVLQQTLLLEIALPP